MKIGITGATGQLGRLVVEKLKQRVNANNLVALVRSPEKASDMGIEVREFDYNKPESLTENLSGIDSLLLISANQVGLRKAQHENIITAAKQANIKWIVYTSLLHADTSSMSLATEHIQTEQMLADSGIPHTILRNGWYTENYTASILGSIEAGSFFGSAGAGKISSATREDYAEAAAVVLSTEGHSGKIYELSGDDYYTLSDLATEVSAQIGKEIPYTDLPEEEFAKALISLDVPESFAKIIANMDVGASKGDLYDQGNVLSNLIGRPTTPLSEVVKRELT
ncbi:SDR family oxidoreductase [Sphingobacterium shayense]|uniref:SDR family oxidoreductase n=1 Tax=Sphingobacterium shayense TaxID=626343 RepID=UPI001557A5BE|nr:SDR family oxidoreductase [Sphingobacterium shayense]NQD72040.1 SDR family oxidoreductase [Sphingobacterium shayense]